MPLYLGEPAGFVVEMENGFRIYHAGDTAVFGDMRLIAELYRPDIALLPIGGHYTMGRIARGRAGGSCSASSMSCRSTTGRSRFLRGRRPSSRPNFLNAVSATSPSTPSSRAAPSTDDRGHGGERRCRAEWWFGGEQRSRWEWWFAGH